MVCLRLGTGHLLAHGVSCQFFGELHLGDGDWTEISRSLATLGAERLGSLYSGFLNVFHLTEDHFGALLVTLVCAKRHILLVFVPYSGRLKRQVQSQG